jgi:hypothetical protein
MELRFWEMRCGLVLPDAMLPTRADISRAARGGLRGLVVIMIMGDSVDFSRFRAVIDATA